MLLGITFIAFMLGELSPSDPAEVSIRVNAMVPTPELIAQTRHELGLDRPLMTRYFEWLAGVGMIAGGAAAAARGRVDALIMRFCDVWMSFPSEVLILALVGMMGPGLENVLIACLLAKWPWYARMMRGLILHLNSAGFVQFARVTGASNMKVLFGHLVPNAAGECFVLGTIDTGSVVLMISALSFLGLGAQPPMPEWGSMLADAKNVMTLYPGQMFVPGLAILLVVAALNFLGDALRDAFDVRRTE